MEDAKKLAEDHWQYVESVLTAHGIDPSEIAMCAHHYRTAFEHGYKHAVEYERTKSCLDGMVTNGGVDGVNA